MGVCALRRGLTAASKPKQTFLACCDGSAGLWRARGESASAPLSRTRLRDHVPSAALSRTWQPWPPLPYAVDTVDAVDAVDPVGTVDAVDAVGTVGTVDAVDPVGAVGTAIRSS